MEKTKNNKEILFLTLENWGGMYEAVIFTAECLKAAGKIAPGSPVLINGNLSFKNGDISTVAEKIISLSALKKSKNQKNREDARSNLLVKTAPLWKS